MHCRLDIKKHKGMIADFRKLCQDLTLNAVKINA